jgi:hypothetical protein
MAGRKIGAAPLLTAATVAWPAMPPWQGLPSERQDESKPGVQLALLVRRQAADPSRRETFVERDQLGNVDNGLPRQTCGPSGKMNVARGVLQPQVGCDDRADHSRDPALVEGI